MPFDLRQPSRLVLLPYLVRNAPRKCRTENNAIETCHRHFNGLVRKLARDPIRLNRVTVKNCRWPVRAGSVGCRPNRAPGAGAMGNKTMAKFGMPKL
jgi:hypothetical protein